jgi:hypothetical protein
LAIGHFKNICNIEYFPKEMKLQNSKICIWRLGEIKNDKNLSLFIIKEMAKFQVFIFI